LPAAVDKSVQLSTRWQWSVVKVDDRQSTSRCRPYSDIDITQQTRAVGSTAAELQTDL